MKTPLQNRREMVSKRPLLLLRLVLVEFLAFLVLAPPTAAETFQSQGSARSGHRPMVVATVKPRGVAMARAVEE